MQENPRATREEQELAQTKRMQEEEAMRGDHGSAEEDEAQEDSDTEEESTR